MSFIILVNYIIPNYSYATTPEEIESIPEYNPGNSVSEEDLTGIIQSVLGEMQTEENDENETGGVLFTPISQFILGIADGVMSTMQSVFIGDEDLTNIITSDSIKEYTLGNNGGKGVTMYRIKYSPAAIFSGTIPAFDINFFSPLGDEEGKTEYYKTQLQYNIVTDNITYEQCKQNYGAEGSLQSIRDKMSLTEIFAHGIALTSVINAVEAMANTDWDYATYGGGAGAVIEVEAIGSIPLPADLGAISMGIFLAAAGVAEGVAAADRLKDKNLYYLRWQNNGETYFYICDSEAWLDTNARENISGTLYKIGEIQTQEIYEKTSTAYTLRPIIATWYVALRNIALVGLLSVLLYMGIRIIISSTSQDKAKYKKMLLDWIIAVLILFILHYLMVFIVSFSQRITELFEVNTIAADGTDNFITNIRNMATGNNNDSYVAYFGYVVMYVALVILTVIFTIQYVKRLIFIAFLTMIAPLIALTYPIDKLKDGQSQAFSMWIREYVFNCLLQPVHLLLYTIFIDSATKLVDTNPVYAVITLAFFIPAINFFRKMFGFEKASSIGTIGAATGGALLMNMINKLQGKTKHSSSDKQHEANRVRTTNTNNNLEYRNGEDLENSKEQKGIGVLSSTNSNKKNNTYLNTNNGIGKTNTRQTGKRKVLKANALKSSGRWIAKTGRWANRNVAKAAGAFGGATIGLAAGVASGNLGDTAKYTGAGAIAGANIAKGVNSKLNNGIKKAYENYQNRILTRKKAKLESQQSSENKKEQDNEKNTNITEDIIHFTNNGLSDINDISTAIENGITGEEYKAYKESGTSEISDIIKLKENEIADKEYKEYRNVGIETIDEMVELKSENILPEDIQKFKDAGQADMKKVVLTKRKHPEYSNEGLANMFKLAKEVPQDLTQFKKIILNRNFEGNEMTEEDAEKIFDMLEDFF